MIFNEEHRTQPITKAQVNEAFKKVRTNGGSPGVDGAMLMILWYTATILKLPALLMFKFRGSEMKVNVYTL